MQLEVDRADLPLREVLTSSGFTSEETGWVDVRLRKQHGDHGHVGEGAAGGMQDGLAVAQRLRV